VVLVLALAAVVSFVSITDGAPSEARFIGAIALAGMASLASWLALQSRARTASALFFATAASVGGAWCAAAYFPTLGSMGFVKWCGLWTRGTDMAWLECFTWIGLAHGIFSGALLALVARAHAVAHETIDGRDRALALALAGLAFVAAASAASIGLAGCVIAACAEIGLFAVVLRDGARLRFAIAAFDPARFALGPPLPGAPRLTRKVHAGVYRREPGRPYRGADRAPIALVPASVADAVKPLRARRNAAALAAVLASALAIACMITHASQ